MRLYMDDMLEKEKLMEGRSVGTGRTASQGSTYLGGTPDQSITNFTGCMSNVFIRR